MPRVGFEPTVPVSNQSSGLVAIVIDIEYYQISKIRKTITQKYTHDINVAFIKVCNLYMLPEKPEIRLN
jgi:hypothetical protein